VQSTNEANQVQWKLSLMELTPWGTAATLVFPARSARFSPSVSLLPPRT